MSSSRPNTQQPASALPSAFTHLDVDQAEAVAARFRPIWDESAPGSDLGFGGAAGNVPFPPPPRPSPPLPAFLSPEALQAPPAAAPPQHQAPQHQASQHQAPQHQAPPMSMGFGGPPPQANMGQAQGGMISSSRTMQLPPPPPRLLDQVSARDPSPDELRIVRPPRNRLVWVVAAGLAGALGVGVLSFALGGPSTPPSDTSTDTAATEAAADEGATKASDEKAAAEKAAAEKAAAEKAASEKLAGEKAAAAEKAAAEKAAAAEKPAEAAPDGGHDAAKVAGARHVEEPKPRAAVARPAPRPAAPPPPPKPAAHDPPAAKPAAAKPGNGAIVRDAPF